VSVRAVHVFVLGLLDVARRTYNEIIDDITGERVSCVVTISKSLISSQQYSGGFCFHEIRYATRAEKFF